MFLVSVVSGTVKEVVVVVVVVVVVFACDLTNFVCSDIILKCAICSNFVRPEWSPCVADGALRSKLLLE